MADVGIREDRYLGILRRFVVGLAQIALVLVVLLLVGATYSWVTGYVEGGKKFDFAAEKSKLLKAADPIVFLRSIPIESKAAPRTDAYAVQNPVSLDAAPGAFLAARQSLAGKYGKSYTNAEAQLAMVGTFIDERMSPLGLVGIRSDNPEIRVFFANVLVDYIRQLAAAAPPLDSDDTATRLLNDHLDGLPSALEKALAPSIAAFSEGRAEAQANKAQGLMMLTSAGMAFLAFLGIMFMFVFIKIEIDLRGIRDTLASQKDGTPEPVARERSILGV